MGPSARKEMGTLASVWTVKYSNNQGSVGPGATAPVSENEATPELQDRADSCSVLDKWLKTLGDNMVVVAVKPGL